jgi:hypothetical protein
MIKQRGKHDCVICTIAMALGLTYEEVKDAAIAEHAYEPDKGTNYEYAILEHLGLRQMHEFCIMGRGILDAAFFRKFSWRRRAILTVPSLNIENGWHSIYTDGKKLYDPCMLKTYSTWDELRPTEMILFA